MTEYEQWSFADDLDALLTVNRADIDRVQGDFCWLGPLAIVNAAAHRKKPIPRQLTMEDLWGI